MYRNKVVALSRNFLLLGTVVELLASNAYAAETPQVVTPSAPPATVATIGTITKLSQELKIAQLQKELRETRKEQPGSQSNAPGQAGNAMVNPSRPAQGSSAFAPKVSGVRAGATELIPPTVVGIFGLGGKLRARLVDGREVQVGQRVGSVAGIWTLKGITAVAATFEICEAHAVPAKRQKADKGDSTQRCLTRAVAPTTL